MLKPEALSDLFDALVDCRYLIESGRTEPLTQREIEATLAKADAAIEKAAGGKVDAAGELI